MRIITEDGMTKRIHPNGKSRRRFLAGVAVWLAGYSISKSYAKERIVTTKQMTLWQAVEVLAKQIPFSKAKIEETLAIGLVEKRRSAHTTFFEGGGVRLLQSVGLTKVDLRLGNRPDDPGLLGIDLEGPCITLDDVRRHYPSLEITDAPRGRSMEEETVYTATLPWGELSFGFKEKNPNCLAGIGFKPKQ